MSIFGFFGLALVVVLGLAILRAVIARALNPLQDVELHELPDPVRREVERVAPDFRAEVVRLSKDGREARLRGQRGGVDARMKIDLDRSGELAEVEFDTAREGGVRRTRIAPEDLPAAASREFDRLLGAIRERMAEPRLAAGTLNGVGNYEIKGRADGFEWEVEVDEHGQLLEYEMEREGR